VSRQFRARYVIEQLEQARSWNSPKEYVAALEELDLGPNIAAFIGHSDMRAATMGLDRACPRSDCCSTN
jgi:N-acyl-D-aspartate/D-glutamate deacylase